MVSHGLCDGFEEDNFLVTWRPTQRQLLQVFELRGEVFCRELGWVNSQEGSLDHDEFDEQAAHIVVLDSGGQVQGAVRMSHCKIPWMLDSVFADVVPSQRVLKQWNTMEASRLVVAKRARTGTVRLENGRGLCELICKGVYNYCQLHGVRHLYMVTTTAVHRHLRRIGVSARALGEPTIMADGVPTLAAKLDWEDVVRDEELRDWYHSVHMVQLPAGEHRIQRKSGVYRIRSARLRSNSKVS